MLREMERLIEAVGVQPRWSEPIWISSWEGSQDDEDDEVREKKDCLEIKDAKPPELSDPSMPFLFRSFDALNFIFIKIKRKGTNTQL